MEGVHVCTSVHVCMCECVGVNQLYNFQKDLPRSLSAYSWKAMVSDSG